MISFKNVSYIINKKVVLSNVSFTFNKGEKVLITGESGCGKSTILNLICKNISPTNGQIYYEKQNINNMSIFLLNEYRKEKVISISQFDDLFSNLTVIDNLSLYYFKEDILLMLKKANLLYLKDRYIYSLSGGERQRIAIIKACLSSCEVLLCDEITSALDKENANKIIDFVIKLFADRTIIFISHDKSIFTNKIDHYLHINNHKIEKDIIINDVNKKRYRPMNKKRKTLITNSIKNGLKNISFSSFVIFLSTVLCVLMFLSFNDVFYYFASKSYKSYFDYNVLLIKDNNDILIDYESVFPNINERLSLCDLKINNKVIKNARFQPFYNKEIENKIVINELFLKNQNIDKIETLSLKSDLFNFFDNDILIIDEQNMFSLACIYYDISYFSSFYINDDINDLIIVDYDFTKLDDRFTNNPLFEEKKEDKPYVENNAYLDYLTFQMVFKSIESITNYYFTIIVFFSIVSMVLITFSKMLKDIKKIAIFISRGYSSFNILLCYYLPYFIYSLPICLLILFVKNILLSLIVVNVIYLIFIIITYLVFKNKNLNDLLKEETL